MNKNKIVSSFAQKFRISCINTYINKKLANYSGMCLCLMLSLALNSKFSYLLVQLMKSEGWDVKLVLLLK